MYENKFYKKMERNCVPWKWMAFEFLETNRFLMKSDVWSYGVLIWEMFSLGGDPYPNQSFKTVVNMLKSGYRLPCPEIIHNIEDWPAASIYDELAEKCFVLQESDRPSFSDIVVFLESKLSEDELKQYKDSAEYFYMRNSILLGNNKKANTTSTAIQFHRSHSAD